MPDDHALSVAPARSFALKNADLVLLIGARLNWILHFGSQPRFAEGVRVIQIDVAAEEIGTNVPASAALVGDAGKVVGQLNALLEEEPWSHPSESRWRSALSDQVERNRAAVEAMMNDDSVPMGYYRVLREVRDQMPRDAILVS